MRILGKNAIFHELDKDGKLAIDNSGSRLKGVKVKNF